LVFAETSSTCAAPPPFRTWKEFIAYFGTLRDSRRSPRFHYVRCSRGSPTVQREQIARSIIHAGNAPRVPSGNSQKR
jgi:hypothetical protein